MKTLLMQLSPEVEDLKLPLTHLVYDWLAARSLNWYLVDGNYVPQSDDNLL